MGNCLQSPPKFGESLTIEGTMNMIEFNQNSLLSRFEAVEGTLFLYKSIITRNRQLVKKEVSDVLEKHKETLIVFTLKREKLYEAILKQVEEQSAIIKEAIENARQSKKKTASLNTLSSTYDLLQDVGDLNDLEDVLQGLEGAIRSKEGFENLFLKYQVQIEETQETMASFDSPVNKNNSNETFRIFKEDSLHSAVYNSQIPMPCQIGC